MRIGMMLRAHDRPGGIGIYSRNIVKHLIGLDKENEYVLLYNNKDHIGTYNHLDNVTEIYIPSANQLLWDQWYALRALKKNNVDIIFNTKFSVPLFTKIKKIMVLHGSSWFVHPELYNKLDILYVKTMMPIYCKAADFLVSNSGLTTNDFINLVGIPSKKVETVHLAAGNEFVPISDENTLSKIRQKYKLPERFILTVTSYDPRKNFSTLLKAFELCNNKTDLDLVVVGKNCHKYGEDFDIKGMGLNDRIHFTGWIEQSDLPALYSLALAYVFPSVYEEFGIPVVEAISCGCPVISSNTGAIPELLGDAAMLCDPFDYLSIADNIETIANSTTEEEKYKSLGLKRSELFSWDKAARKTIDILEAITGK